MKFPLHSHTWHDTSIREDDGTPVAHCATTSIRDELIRRANAFDELLKALKAATDHLDYCGWGDTWERECVRDSGDQKMIEDTLAKYGDKT
jgi:hypothetical protein